MMMRLVMVILVSFATAPRAEVATAPVKGFVQWSGAFRDAMARCWNVGGLSPGAAVTRIIVGVEFLPDGRPVEGSLRLVAFENGDQAQADEAFAAASRAIMRCAGDGYDLPADQYQIWQKMEINFDANLPTP